MTILLTTGHWEFSATSLYMVSLHLRMKARWIHSKGMEPFMDAFTLNKLHLLLMNNSCLYTYYCCRIKNIDLAFPSTPGVSAEAKDLISRVIFFHFHIG